MTLNLGQGPLDWYRTAEFKNVYFHTKFPDFAYQLNSAQILLSANLATPSQVKVTENGVKW